jgi:hypothetical protein
MKPAGATRRRDVEIALTRWEAEFVAMLLEGCDDSPDFAEVASHLARRVRRVLAK